MQPQRPLCIPPVPCLQSSSSSPTTAGAAGVQVCKATRRHLHRPACQGGDRQGAAVGPRGRWPTEATSPGEGQEKSGEVLGRGGSEEARKRRRGPAPRVAPGSALAPQGPLGLPGPGFSPHHSLLAAWAGSVLDRPLLAETSGLRAAHLLQGLGVSLESSSSPPGGHTPWKHPRWPHLDLEDCPWREGLLQWTSGASYQKKRTGSFVTSASHLSSGGGPSDPRALSRGAKGVPGPRGGSSQH